MRAFGKPIILNLSIIHQRTVTLTIHICLRLHNTSCVYRSRDRSDYIAIRVIDFAAQIGFNAPTMGASDPRLSENQFA